MKDYTRGLRDGMLETAKKDLEQVATRIAILEDDLHKERNKKWDLIRKIKLLEACLLYTSPSPRDGLLSRMPSSA